jgi:hypothetical protein
VKMTPCTVRESSVAIRSQPGSGTGPVAQLVFKTGAVV